jgi:hypothetical protein
MAGRWFRRIFGTEDADLDERRRIAAEHDRQRTDAIIQADRMTYGHRLDSPLDPGLGPDRSRDRRQP